MLEAALHRSDIVWLRTDRDRATWFAPVPAGSPAGPSGSLLVAAGGPEPELGDLAAPHAPLHVILRSKGDGRRLLVLPATAAELVPPSPSVTQPLGEGSDADGPWTAATALLRTERIGGGPDIVSRWRAESRIWLIRPAGRPVESPDRPPPTALVAEVVRPLP